MHVDMVNQTQKWIMKSERQSASFPHTRAAGLLRASRPPDRFPRRACSHNPATGSAPASDPASHSPAPEDDKTQPSATDALPEGSRPFLPSEFAFPIGRQAGQKELAYLQVPLKLRIIDLPIPLKPHSSKHSDFRPADSTDPSKCGSSRSG